VRLGLGVDARQRQPGDGLDAWPVGVAPAFSIEGAKEGITLSGSGTVMAAEDAPEGEVKLTATIRGRSVGSVLQVVSRERYDALLAAGGFDETGASSEAAVVRLESVSVGARSTVLEDDSARRRTLFIGLVGGAALLLGVLGFVMVRRGRNRRPAGIPEAPAEAPVERRQPRRGTVCPTCREEYPPGAEFCPVDGNRLVTLDHAGSSLATGLVCPVCGQGFDPGVNVCPKHDEPLVPPAVLASRAAEPVKATRKICPVCGMQYGGESQFCGKCGAALVPVN
jgi:ribosomal protein S27AE